ncbi:MFS transporter [Candidatus Woesearchaeota archaeon]|mgnify:FL=1|jgi:MFS family permease|nr:MFS transporter [Candidatus Woesearchaeota archaeon]MBT7062627.1 MFS transporter [Candidatus Woesearchaeota archaeon]MBT7402727.1 MFS transporter [Candidatus Woesearchaeota archaeon]
MKKQLKILLAADSFFVLAAGLFGPIYAVYVQQIGGDLLTAGGAYSAFAFTSGILIYLIGKWEDHVKHLDKLLIASYALSCFGFVGYLLIQRPLHLFAVQIVFGIAGAINKPAYDALYSKYLAKTKAASQWGAWEGMVWISSAIGAVVGGYIAQIYGFRTLFTIMLGISIIGLIAVSFLVKKSK